MGIDVAKRSGGEPSTVDESREALKRVERDTQSIGGSPLPPLGRRAAGSDGVGWGDHGGRDPIEIWGRRIGRGFSAVLAVVLTWWLGAQLGWL